MADARIFNTIPLIAAPPAMQPGGYIPEAYKGRLQATTPSVDIAAVEQGKGWVIELGWDCPNPVNNIANETDLFTDAAAILVPGTMDAPWLTMGAPDHPVEAALWRADKSQLFRMRAEGLGTMSRGAPPPSWTVDSSWENGRWHLRYLIGDWPVLSQFGRVGVAIWRGENQDRGGLKSVTEGWVAVR
jgi:DMSO reductase family type II enzyme heme b subunit